VRENVTARAQRLLLKRRVAIHARDRRHLVAHVLGDSSITHEVRWDATRGWSCTCEAATYRSVCAHVVAVQHVTVINRDHT
jgi:hypothetical protein